MILTIGALVKDDQGRQYILDELLGSGGFGSVFKAHRDTHKRYEKNRKNGLNFPRKQDGVIHLCYLVHPVQIMIIGCR